MFDEIRTISIEDKIYPKLLKGIKNAPKILYYRGNLPQKENCFAVVGTRRCSEYGKQMALEIAGDLAQSGLTIVSGLAPGIDTLAHQAAVERKKRTIAVLGTGIDTKTIYPQSNLRLVDKILENGGCIVSEYPAGFHGSKITFPERNRIVSGMSLGVLVIEAKEKSGSLITAGLARAQKKKLFALPGPVKSANSKGTNYLIKTGAFLTEDANDILKELHIPLKEKSADVSGDNIEEDLILKVLREGALDIEKIIEKTNLSAATIAGTLALLEIKNKIKNIGQNTYAIGNR